MPTPQLRVNLNSVKPFALALACLALLVSCHKSESAAQPAANQKHFPFTGRIVSVDTPSKTASIDGSAIPNYMDAMTMDYPIPAQDDLAKLHPGDLISATVNVGGDGSYNLSAITITGHKDTKK